MSAEHGQGAVDGCYFPSALEADAWLSFDATDEEAEVAFQAENDRHAEWECWRMMRAVGRA